MTATSRLPRECSLGDGRPKVRYETRAEAKAASKQHGRGEHAYKCRHCGYIHLATTKPTVGLVDPHEELMRLLAQADVRARHARLEVVFLRSFMSAGPPLAYDGGFVGSFVSEAKA